MDIFFFSLFYWKAPVDDFVVVRRNGNWPLISEDIIWSLKKPEKLVFSECLFEEFFGV